MNPRRLSLIVCLVVMALAGAITAAVARHAKDHEAPKAGKQKTEMVFNWVSSS